MISEENKEFLKKYFNIDCSKYNEKQISNFLDNIFMLLDKQIKEKELNILNLKKDLITQFIEKEKI